MLIYWACLPSMRIVSSTQGFFLYYHGCKTRSECALINLRHLYQLLSVHIKSHCYIELRKTIAAYRESLAVMTMVSSDLTSSSFFKVKPPKMPKNLIQIILREKKIRIGPIFGILGI